MVIVRLLAELTVMISLLLLPLALMLLGHFESLQITWKVITGCLAALACFTVPAYGFVTWIVTVEDQGLTARALFKNQSCTWKSIKTVSRRSNWNWQRYVVEHDDGDLTFPIWLKNVDKLVETIRSRLPASSASRNSDRRFFQDPISLSFQILQAFMGVALAIVFWFFFAQLQAAANVNSQDSYIVLAFSLILTFLIAWRTFIVLLMPRRVSITNNELVIETLFFKRNLTWEQVQAVGPSLPLLPDGFMIKTKCGAFLIGNGMDSADDLLSTIKAKLPEKPKT